MSSPQPDKTLLTGKKIIVTAGPCREPIDPVRFISNRSSGKMGYALAEAALRMGAEVVLISGPTSLARPEGVEFVQIETTDQMHAAVTERFGWCDALIMAAAPSDFKPVQSAEQKIKKREGLKLELEPTVDILKSLKGKKRPDQRVIGFALETENGIENARTKLVEKNLDLIVLNESSAVQSAFDSDTNRVTLIRPDREPEVWDEHSKIEISGRLLDIISKMY